MLNPPRETAVAVASMIAGTPIRGRRASSCRRCREAGRARCRSVGRFSDNVPAAECRRTRFDLERLPHRQKRPSRDPDASPVARAGRASSRGPSREFFPCQKPSDETLLKLLRHPNVRRGRPRDGGGARNWIWCAGRRLVTPIRFQTDRSLGIGRFVTSYRVEKRIRESVIDGAQSRRAAVGQVSNLDRRGLPGKCQQAAAVHVHGQIDQDVDAVVADLPSQLLVGERCGVTPDCGGFFGLFCECVGAGDAAVADNLEFLTVVMLQRAARSAGRRDASGSRGRRGPLAAFDPACDHCRAAGRVLPADRPPAAPIVHVPGESAMARNRDGNAARRAGCATRRKWNRLARRRSSSRSPPRSARRPCARFQG